MSALDTVMNMAKSIGGQALASLYPNDFEWYMVALELADSDDNTIDYLTFPIMPDSISKTEPTRTNIKKSMAGVTVLSTPSYSPQEINIKGSFGRQFKILINPKPDASINSSKSVSAGKYYLFDIAKKSGLISGLAFSNFNLNVKTGYGVMKILQAMASKSVGLDDKGKPLRLYFYNMALGESYLVAIPPSGVQFSQDLSKNMIWNYNLTLIALAPLEAVSNKNDDKSLLDKLLPSMIQTGVSEVASVVTDALQPVTEKVLEGWL